MAKERNGRHLTPNPRARSERRVDQATSHGLLRVFLAVILVAVSFVGGFALRSQTELVASWGIPVSDGEREALAAAAASNHLRVRLGPGGRCGGHPLHVLHGRDRPYIGHLFHARRLDEVHRRPLCHLLQPRSVQHLHQGDHRAQLRRHRGGVRRLQRARLRVGCLRGLRGRGQRRATGRLPHLHRQRGRIGLVDDRGGERAGQRRGRDGVGDLDAPGEPGTPRPASSSPRRSPARSTRRRTSPPRFPTAWAS